MNVIMIMMNIINIVIISMMVTGTHSIHVWYIYLHLPIKSNQM